MVTYTSKNSRSEWNSWNAMRHRCHNPNNPGFEWYGKRGITVCERWRKSFQHFVEDMGTKPGPDYSLDRIDNDGPYTPENCRWATRAVQAKNRSKKNRTYVRRNYTFDGRTESAQAWAKELNCSVGGFRYRANKGWNYLQLIGAAPPLPAQVGAWRSTSTQETPFL